MSKVSSILIEGGVAVILTDTVYGVVAAARNRAAVSRLYRLRRKTPKKPFIILIKSLSDLSDFGINPTAAQRKFLKEVWPGKVSVILPCHSRKLSYLHLGTNTLAFRLPKSRALRNLLKETGPLVAPSANREGEKPAASIGEAKKYFGDKIDYYAGSRKGGRGMPSTVVSFLGETPELIRQGEVFIRPNPQK